MDAFKEVTMDVVMDMTGQSSGSGGGGRGRRRRVRKTQRGGGDASAASDMTDSQMGGRDVAVEKVPQAAGVAVSVSVKPAVAPVPVPVPVSTTSTPAAVTTAAALPQAGGGSGPQKVVIAPPKKRPPKLLLVPGAAKPSSASTRAAALQKTFKAHKVRVLIDNTAKTQRRRRQTMQAVEAMTEEQLRAAAVAARLSRRETVAKVPVDLLRQMLKDYRMMRGMLL